MLPELRPGTPASETAYWDVASSPQGIVITCRGHDREHLVARAVTAFHTAVARSEGPFSIIADLREMTGYESESRKAWQVAFYRHRARIGALVLVGAQSALIRMGAAAVGAVAGIPVKFVASWDQVPR